MNKHILFLLITAIFTLNAHSSPVINVQEIGNGKAWLNLLHYGDGWILKRNRSRADSAYFFISPNGATDPVAELQATASALQDPKVLVGRDKVSAACAFPTRKQYLEKVLGVKYPNPPCPALEEYLGDTAVDKAVLVFSTAYPNNPGSMFGHTFIKLIAPGKPDLLQPSLSYAAFVGDDAGFVYMARGLFGGYPGKFDLTPYYAKVNEYVRSESRDLWEYELNLTPAEVKTVALHIWELEKNGGFDYYFFDENCSYILMRILEVAKPEWKIAAPALFTIPGVTVRQVMDQKDAVRSVQFRPSLRRQVNALFKNLNEEEAKTLQALMGGDIKAENVSSSRVLDVALAQIQYQKTSSTPFALEVRKARSKFTAPSLVATAEQTSASNRPDYAHGPTQFSLGGGALDGNSFGTLGFKFAYHDLLNDDLGYERFSHIDFPSVKFKIADHKGLYLDRLGFVSITSLFPWSQLEKSKSWKINLDVRTVRDLKCPSCRVAHLEYGVGVALFPWTENIVTAGLISGYAEAGSVLGTARLGPKGEWLTVANFWSWSKTMIDASWTMDPFQSKRNVGFWTFDFGQSVRIARDWDFRLNYSWIASDLWHSSATQEAQSSLQYYW